MQQVCSKLVFGKATRTFGAVQRRRLVFGFPRPRLGGAKVRYPCSKLSLATRVTHTQTVKYTAEKGSRAVGIWLLGCSTLVFGTVVVGGLTRLTDSGLSMVQWKFTGSRPPMTTAEWEDEFNQYKQYPQYEREFQDMTLSEFKRIYAWEYGHRMLGRLVGISFLLPFSYFAATGRVRGRALGQCGALLAGICGQGLLGWYMVKSGLHLSPEERARVSQYRLTAHLSTAFALYGGMLWTAFSHLLTPQSLPISSDALATMTRLRTRAGVTLGLLSITIMSGCLVAGLDAGMIYNTFPLMGGDLVPSDYWARSTIIGTLGENEASVQFNHRWLAMTTAGSVFYTYWALRKGGLLPSRTRIAVKAMAHMTILQVTLGVSTLLMVVPVHLASAHQAGALTLWSLTLWALHELRRFPK